MLYEWWQRMLFWLHNSEPTWDNAALNLWGTAILNPPSTDNRRVIGSDSRQIEEIIRYSPSIPLITTLISLHVCNSSSVIAQNFDSFGGINNSFWLWRRGIRLKNTCASSTARAGSSAFPKIQRGTEREAREAEWGALTAVKAHAPLPSPWHCCRVLPEFMRRCGLGDTHQPPGVRTFYLFIRSFPISINSIMKAFFQKSLWWVKG